MADEKRKLSRQKLLDFIDWQIDTIRSCDYSKTDEMNNKAFEIAGEYRFKSDHGDAFARKYCDGGEIPVDDIGKLREILAGVKSYKELGSLYFSYWREVTHFMDADPFNEEHGEPLIAMLERLREVASVKSKVKETSE